MKKIPVSIITGFLGSGKTTLLNKIMQQNEDLKMGILLNEFGDVALESQFVQKTDEEVVELPNGCVCCVARGELLDGLGKIVEAKPEVEYIILEASGLSDPLSLMLTFYNPLFTQKFRLDTVIGVVDYLNFENIMDIYDIARHQVHFSNIVVISKSKPEDNLTQITELISELNPKAIQYVDSEKFNTDVLLDKVMLDPAEVDMIRSQIDVDHHEHETNDDVHDHEPHVHEEVDHIFYETDKPLDYTRLEKFLEDKLPKSVIRAKGFVHFSNAPVAEKKYLLQYVAGRKDWFRSDWDREQSTGILFVGKNLDKVLILEGLKTCEI